MQPIARLMDYVQYPQSLERLGICSTCPEFNTDDLKCAQCGCLMPAKVLIPTLKCPMGKW
jgi:hypothetical protein